VVKGRTRQIKPKLVPQTNKTDGGGNPLSPRRTRELISKGSRSALTQTASGFEGCAQANTSFSSKVFEKNSKVSEGRVSPEVCSSSSFDRDTRYKFFLFASRRIELDHRWNHLFWARPGMEAKVLLGFVLRLYGACEVSI